MAVIDGDYTCEICGETFETNVAIAAHTRAHKTEVSRDEILTAIQTLADELGRPPTSDEFNDEAPLSTTAVRSEFGAWNEALQVAGYEPHFQYLSDEDIIQAI